MSLNNLRNGVFVKCWQWIYKISVFLLIQIMLIGSAYCKQEEYISFPDTRQMLSPELTLNKQQLRQVFEKELMSEQMSEQMPARFLMHVRPLSLLCKIASIIKKQEQITIYVKVVSNDGKDVIEFEEALHANKKFATIITPFNVFMKFANGALIIKKEHSFYLTFVDEQGVVVKPLHLISFFRNFFANQVAGVDGNFIDVPFWHNDYDSFNTLPEVDFRRIIHLLGYGEDSEILLEMSGYNLDPQQEEKKPKSDYFLSKKYLEMLDVYTPDYKGTSGALTKVDFSQEEKTDNTNRILSAI